MKKTARHLKLKRKAEIVDLIIDQYNRVRKRKRFPRKVITNVVNLFFPESRHLGRGAFKEVLLIRSQAYKYVLKVSSLKSTGRDWKIYNRLPRTLRNRYYAKIYWRTKYSLLQKYGKRVQLPDAELKKLRKFAKKYGLTDVRPGNIRKIDKHFKIVDANSR